MTAPSPLSAWHPAAVLATWFGSGLLPKAPGTWGSLAALPFAWVIVMFGGPIALAVATLVVFLVGWWAAARYVAASGQQDPGAIVIDEVAGQWLVLIAAPQDLLSYGIGFVLFRIVDITKPWPANWADRTVHGGLGVMLDDVLAAVYAALIMAGLAMWTGGA